MSDLDDMLDGFEEPVYQETEKKGAPKIDDADLAGLLDDEPAVWTGNDQKRGAPVLETQNLLDEPEQTWQEQKPAASHDALLNTAAADLLGAEPAAYDPVEEFCQKLQFDENLKAAFVNLDAEKQMQVVNMRAQQLGIPAPMIPNELRPKSPAPAEERRGRSRHAGRSTGNGRICAAVQRRRFRACKARSGTAAERPSAADGTFRRGKAGEPPPDGTGTRTA